MKFEGFLLKISFVSPNFNEKMSHKKITYLKQTNQWIQFVKVFLFFYITRYLGWQMLMVKNCQKYANVI